MRRTFLLLPVLAAALLSAACGGSDAAAPKPLPKIDVAQATARTADAGSASFSLSGEGGRGGPFTGEGELAGNRAKLELHFAEAGGGLFPADVEVVYADGALYLRLSGVAGLLSGLTSGGKDYRRGDLAAETDVLDEYRWRRPETAPRDARGCRRLRAGRERGGTRRRDDALPGDSGLEPCGRVDRGGRARAARDRA